MLILPSLQKLRVPFILDMNISSKNTVHYTSLMTIRMLVLIILQIQRRILVLVLILHTGITDTSINLSMNINMHIGTSIHNTTTTTTTTSSHIHIDFGTTNLVMITMIPRRVLMIVLLPMFKLIRLKHSLAQKVVLGGGVSILNIYIYRTPI